RGFLGPIGFGGDPKRGEALALLAKDGDYVSCGASAQCYQHIFHRPWRGGAFGVDHYSVTGRSHTQKLLTARPVHLCDLVCHLSSYLRLSDSGSVWISTLKISGACCLNRISRAVETSCTRAKVRASAMVQWHEM